MGLLKLTLVTGKLNPGILLLVELEGEGREGLDKLPYFFPRLREWREGGNGWRERE